MAAGATATRGGASLISNFTRKRNRLHLFDYKQTGAYFITTNTKNNEELFGRVIEEAPPPVNTDDVLNALQADSTSIMVLNAVGELVDSEVRRLNTLYDCVSVDFHVVMPNHVHMIISVVDSNGDSGKPPPLSDIIGHWKRAVSVKLWFSPWQKSFYDHVIRNEDDYHRIAEYIVSNPARWHEDRYNASAQS